MLGGWVRTDFDVAVLFRVWSVDSDHRVANVPVAGICGAVDCWDSAGFRCGGWLVVGCRVLPVWTGSVFGSRFPVWSVVWVFHVGDRVVVDCRSVRDSLESGGFVVLPWLVVGCRSVLVWTGSDFVVWFPIQSA